MRLNSTVNLALDAGTPAIFTRHSRCVWLACSVLCAIALAGCGLVPTSVKDRGVDLVNQGCTRLTLSERQLARQEINTGVAPAGHAWCGFRCKGDPPPNVPACLAP